MMGDHRLADGLETEPLSIGTRPGGTDLLSIYKLEPCRQSSCPVMAAHFTAAVMPIVLIGIFLERFIVK